MPIAMNFPELYLSQQIGSKVVAEIETRDIFLLY